MAKKRTTKPANAGAPPTPLDSAASKAAAAKAEKAANAAATPIHGSLKVRATAVGYYNEKRRREGDVFTLKTREAFSSKWMEYVDKSVPERLTHGQTALNQQMLDQRANLAGLDAHDEPTADENPLSAGKH